MNSKCSSKQQTPRQPTCASLEWPSQHTAARVAQSMSISLVDHLLAMWNAIFSDIKRYIRQEHCVSITGVGGWPFVLGTSLQHCGLFEGI